MIHHVNTLRAVGYNCTNGISKTENELTASSNPADKDKVDLLIVEGGRGSSKVILGKDVEYYKAIPTKHIESIVNGNVNMNAWVMASGNFVWSCDSRFRAEFHGYPIAIHDRVEK